MRRPGFIAGVTNPAFQSHDNWWDVLCDIPTGKVILSSKLYSTTPYGWVPQVLSLNSPSSIMSPTSPEDAERDRDRDKDKEKELIAHDLEFMREV